LFKRCDGDWNRFYAAVRKMGREPAQQREAFLSGGQNGGNAPNGQGPARD
jgi:predicted aminopeptidase